MERERTIPSEESLDETLIGRVAAYFESHSLRYARVGSRTLRAGFGLPTGPVDLSFHGNESLRELLVHGRIPVRVPDEHRFEALELVSMINLVMRLGRVTLDLRTGDLEYRHTAFIGSRALSFEIVDRLLGVALGTIDDVHRAARGLVVEAIPAEMAFQRLLELTPEDEPADGPELAEPTRAVLH